MRIFVAEDNSKVAEHIRQGLTAEGHAVDVAVDGDEVIWLAELHSYDAIVLDVMMPSADGFTVVRQLRRKQVSTPVLFLIFDWDFGDALPHSTNQYPAHAYAVEGNYAWSVISRLSTNGVSIQTTTNAGIIAIGPAVNLAANPAGNSVVLS